MALPSAGNAAVQRAAQKDEYFEQKLGGAASEALRLFGNRRWHQYYRYIPAATHTIYHALTTLRDLQTLGEEYTGLVQVDDSYMSIPPKLMQLLAILLGAFGEPFVKSLLNLTKDNVLKSKELLPKPKRIILKLIAISCWLLPIMQELHQAWFFLGGSHYNIQKRLLGINYVNAVPGRVPRMGALRPLGVPYLLRAILSAVRSPPTFQEIEVKTKPRESTFQYTPCASCLESNTVPCALPCGHIFCNHCSRASTACAVCRAPYLQHRTVPLQNLVLKI